MITKAAAAIEGSNALHAACIAANYAVLKDHKNAGGNCVSCAHAHNTTQHHVECKMKRNKTVNKLAICHLFKGAV